MKSTRLKIIDRILEVIGESHTIAVCSHMRPDGDCIGSSLGLALALLELAQPLLLLRQFNFLYDCFRWRHVFQREILVPQHINFRLEVVDLHVVSGVGEFNF